MWYNGYWVVLLRGYTFVLGYWVLLREWIGNRGGLDGFALDNTGGQRVVDFSCFFLLLLFENWKDWKTEDCNWFEFIRNPGSRIRNGFGNSELGNGEGVKIGVVFGLWVFALAGCVVYCGDAVEMGGNWRDLISDFGFRISEMSASENRGGLQSFSLGGWGAV